MEKHNKTAKDEQKGRPKRAAFHLSYALHGFTFRDLRHLGSVQPGIPMDTAV